MFLSGRARDHIPDVDLFDGTFPTLDDAATGHYNERLTERMGVPCRVGPWLERDARPLNAPRGSCLEQGLNAHLAGEPFPGTLARRSRTASFDLHVLHAPLSLDSGSKASAVDREPVAHVAALHACI